MHSIGTQEYLRTWTPMVVMSALVAPAEVFLSLDRQRDVARRVGQRH